MPFNQPIMRVLDSNNRDATLLHLSQCRKLSGNRRPGTNDGNRPAHNRKPEGAGVAHVGKEFLIRGYALAVNMEGYRRVTHLLFAIAPLVFFDIHFQGVRNPPCLI